MVFTGSVEIDPERTSDVISGEATLLVKARVSGIVEFSAETLGDGVSSGNKLCYVIRLNVS